VKAGPDEAIGRNETIVSTEWLAQNLGAKGLRVLDVRGKILPPGANPRYLPKRDEYGVGHVPGAVFVDWTRDIVDPDDPIPAQVARPEAFAAKMSELGIGDDTLVVVYDDYDHVFAGRLAWALRYYGHDEVRVLDGGFARWVAEGRPTTAAQPPVARGAFLVRTRGALRRTSDEVARSLGDPGVLLIDARAPAQYEGSTTVAARAGHIPGARNVHYAKLVDASTGRFLPREELVRVFAQAGVDVAKLPRDVVVYCNGGVTCTVPMMALQLLGQKDVAVFDGSWNEWGNDPSRPVKTGSEP
jgi:thiosulfate/3-mercaptopyruvate sulfurtransferase